MSNADPGRARPVFQWLAQLFALMGKESKQIIRDPSSYLVAAILPMIFLLLFGYGITLDAGVMDIVILDESNSQSGLQLQENFAHSPNFRVHQARSRSEAGRMMRDSVISGFIVIPYNFEALLVGGQGKAAVAPIQVIVSGGEPNTANFIRGYSQGVIANWQQDVYKRQGYDHIAGAIGGAMAVRVGVDFLCYLTPAEHLTLPDMDDVRQGIMASRVAAQAGEVALGRPHALAREAKMAKARMALDWPAMREAAIDPAILDKRREPHKHEEACAMCGNFCAVKMLRDAKQM